MSGRAGLVFHSSATYHQRGLPNSLQLLSVVRGFQVPSLVGEPFEARAEKGNVVPPFYLHLDRLRSTVTYTTCAARSTFHASR